MSTATRNETVKAINNVYAGARALLADMDDACAQYKQEGTTFAKASAVSNYYVVVKLKYMADALADCRAELNAICVQIDTDNAVPDDAADSNLSAVHDAIATILAYVQG